MFFAAYYPLSKGVIRTCICTFAMPSILVAYASFAYTGVLNPTRDWLSLMVVCAAAFAGISVGNYFHKRISNTTVNYLVLICLGGAAVELLSEENGVRLLLAVALGASAAGILVCPERPCQGEGEAQS